MHLNPILPRKSLNKAFLKLKPNRSQIEQFKGNLIQLLDRINESESEEFHKNLVIDFLKKTYYEPNHYINTKGRTDLVIHNGNSASTSVGVIIEAKKPTNRSEMLAKEKINVKAFQELVLYYMRERIANKNLEIKYLIATNIYEWFVFDANIFEKHFAHSKSFVKQFNDFEGGRLSGKTTDFFYKDIAEPFINSLEGEIEFTHLDIRSYEKPLRNTDKTDDTKLIALFKLLSPEHLLKLPFTNDSNTLDKRFYGELLHIIGLTETKEGGKKVIGRSKEGQRNSGSLIENAITQLDSLDKINRLERKSQFGANLQEQLFNVALELSITWINRILFLKLLEAQLITYHKGDRSFSFLNMDLIKNYDDLNSLFFQVLARRYEERDSELRAAFQRIPYLNSSLFEPNDLEHTTLFISNLRDEKPLPIYSATVLKDKQGKKRTGTLNALEYLFEFLNAYDFASEGSEDIQEDNKTLINASVLGLIFEKINGYKDGSFFTPGFITMYMCRETIRRAVVQKFNEAKTWECKTIDELYNRIEDRKEANSIINSLKICDPAVGSGHFLVSALNEIIAIKNDLRILQDREGKRLKEYHVEVENDELIVTDEEGVIFEYNPKSPESQRVQETLFHEKQTIIENCLFGVDINPNSVKICRLRLWIELLKNAYYKNETELETLPNIDINIKCGNSLISRFAIDADLGQALKRSKWTIDSYRLAVDTYRNAHSKEEKREMERLIADIKSDFRSEITQNDPKLKRLQKAKGELFTLTNQTTLFEKTKKEKEEWNKKVKKLTDEINRLETEIEEIKNNKIYENSFEWRFEFPEVLNEKGDFVGFDVVIGNPPYGAQFDDNEKKYIKNKFSSYQYKFDSYVYFMEMALKILKNDAFVEFIVPILWMSLENCKPIRDLYLNKNNFQRVYIHGENVFEEAVVNTCSIQTIKQQPSKSFRIINNLLDFNVEREKWIDNQNFKVEYRLDLNSKLLIDKIRKSSIPLSNLGDVVQGITPYDSYRGHSKEIIISKAFHFDFKKDETCGRWLEGKNLKRYSISWDNKWLSYGDWLAAPREKKFFEGKRIIFREVTGTGKRIQATIVDELFYYGHSISPFKPNNDDHLHSILGIVNSRLISWFAANYFPNFGKDVFPKLNPNDIKEIPIHQNFKLNKLDNIVNQILMLKKEDNLADTTELETQIDQLVYQLYGLTDDEIAIVEGSVK